MPATGGHAPFAPALLGLRFPSMKRSDGHARGIIDDLNGTGRPFFDIAALPNVIPRGAPIYVSGWLYEPRACAPPEIVITVDGAFGVVASAGFARPDVAGLLGPDAANCGFEAVLPSASIGEGVRTIAAAVLLDAMTYRTGPERRITIARSALRTAIETPVVAGVHAQIDYVAVEEQLRVGGWAADLAQGQPSAAVYAIVDDVHLFRGRYGRERADVANEFGLPQLRYSGYEVRIDPGALAAGDHLIRVVALSGDGEGRSEATAALPFAIPSD